MKKGFTLMELIIVVIIIGILAMLGLPQFFRVAERGRAAEGIAILGALRNAQLRYSAFSVGNVSASDMSDLDVDTSALRYFSVPTVSSIASPGMTNNTVASIARSTGTYTINITGTGYLSCAPAASCPPLGQ